MDHFCENCDGMGRTWDPVDYDAYADIYVDGERVSLYDSLAHRAHSPTGFAWGYNGSGPAQLALAILLRVASPAEAMVHYQQFKADVIARLCKDEPFEFVFDYEEWRDSHSQSGVTVLTGRAY